MGTGVGVAVGAAVGVRVGVAVATGVGEGVKVGSGGSAVGSAPSLQVVARAAINNRIDTEKRDRLNIGTPPYSTGKTGA
jgi:hypothetical protein